MGHCRNLAFPAGIHTHSVWILYGTSLQAVLLHYSLRRLYVAHTLPLGISRVRVSCRLRATTLCVDSRWFMLRASTHCVWILIRFILRAGILHYAERTLCALFAKPLWKVGRVGGRVLVYVGHHTLCGFSLPPLLVRLGIFLLFHAAVSCGPPHSAWILV